MLGEVGGFYSWVGLRGRGFVVLEKLVEGCGVWVMIVVFFEYCGGLSVFCFSVGDFVVIEMYRGFVFLEFVFLGRDRYENV